MKILTHSHFIDIGDIRLPIQIRKHRTSRRLVVRYQPLNKSLSLTLPQATSIKQGLHFVNEKRQWISNQLMQYSNIVTFSDGQEIIVLGKNMRLEHVGGRGLVSEMEDALHIHGDIEFMPRRVKNFLTQKLKSEIISLAQNFAAHLNIKIKSITLRDTSSRWGSCSHDGSLSFSWRLIFAPYEVMSYVVAHEVAHIREHNHSDSFWKLVEELSPQFEVSEKWLKKNGKLLYMYSVT